MRDALFLFLLVTTLGATACQRGSATNETAAPPAVTVRARGVEVRTFPDVITAPGQWRATGEAAVIAPFAAVVESLEVRLGEHVAKGQVLCLLVTRDAQAAVRGAAVLSANARDAAGHHEATRAAELARRDRVPIPIVAPRAGTVTRLAVVDGGEVAESGEILALVSAAALAFEARVRPADAARIRPGQRGAVTEADRPDRLVVVRMALPTMGEADQSVLVWLRPQDTAQPLAIGRFGNATIEVGAPITAPALPDSAIVQDDLTGENRVAVVSADGKACWVPVTLGARGGGWRQLLAPSLAPGTLVVTDGQRGLPDSTQVRTTR